MAGRQTTAHFPDRLGGFDLRTTPLLRTDVLVIGGGVAGGAAALHAAAEGAEVLVLAKTVLGETNTAYAQGGIAAALLPEDDPGRHAADTLRTGAGIADPAVVRHVVTAASAALQWLEQLGARFDRDAGGLLLSREGGHSLARVVHSNG
ncbi:MAG TPA: FAD-dependent oxidoreductase, partial [Planctomycetota bacterium]|nr:FAD-dependent oxidoreductase [Planctomycetota bacterium]